VLSVRDKASGEIFAVAGLADPADVDAAAASARAAQPAWASTTYADRAAILRAAAAALSGGTAGLRELIMRETGCIGGKADYEIAAATSELIEAAALASRSPGELVPTTHSGRLSLCERVPVGLVGVITPWNFPLVLGMRVIAPALALGNAVLLKPSPETPLSGGLAIAGLFAEAGAAGPACSRCYAVTSRWVSAWSPIRTSRWSTSPAPPRSASRSRGPRVAC
jgi:benzaldehyde dehydrogenase (NAD)